MFWLLTAWLIAVGLGSIIPQLFGTGNADGSAALTCVPALADLRNELLEHSAESVEHLGKETSHVQLESWFLAFDARLMALKAACAGTERKAWKELLRLRHGLSGWLDRLAREQASRMRYLDTALSDVPADAP